jgi:hypothetical protein
VGTRARAFFANSRAHRNEQPSGSKHNLRADKTTHFDSVAVAVSQFAWGTETRRTLPQSVLS